MIASTKGALSLNNPVQYHYTRENIYLGFIEFLREEHEYTTTRRDGDWDGDPLTDAGPGNSSARGSCDVQN